MYAAKVFITILVMVLLQVLIPTLTRFQQFNYVDLPLIATVYFSLRRSQLLGMMAGMSSGLMYDALSHSYLGVGGLTKTIIGFAVATLSLRIELDNFLLRLLTLAAAAVCNTVIFIYINKILGLPRFLEITTQEMWRGVGIATGVNLGAALFIFLILDRLLGRPDPAKVETVRPRFYR